MSVDVNTGEIAPTINYRVHPAADIFPLIEGADFQALVDDIREHGQMEPVVLDAEGRLIDGRNRARACQALGIDVRETTYGGDDVAQFVVSHNLHRRHLTDSQRAMIAARLANLPQHLHRDHPDTPDGVSRSEAKSLLGVSEGSMHRAKMIERSGTPDLVALTSEGKVPLASAARVAEADPADQDEFVAAVKGGEEPTKASLRVKPPKPKPRPSRDAKADMLADLAEQGYSSRQMCKQLGYSRDGQVRDLAREYGIEIPADQVIGKTRRHDSTRIVESLVEELASMQASIDLIDYSDLDGEQADQWANSLDESFKVLNRFRKQIKELTQ